MRWWTNLYLNGLGVLELLENAQTVLEDVLGRRRRPEARLDGKTAIVTGGNAGVGYATAEALLRRGCGVVLAVRDQARGDAAAARLAATVGGNDGGSGAKPSSEPPAVAVELLDLASLASVRAFVARWAAGGHGLDLLILNAGIMCPPDRVLTADGYELQFQSNYLSHFALANQLVQHQRRLRQRGSGGAAGPAAAARPLRVVWLTSMTHFGGDLSRLQDVPVCSAWHSFQAYANSKLCTLLAAKHLDRLFARATAQQLSSGGTGAAGRDASVAVHPGLVDTSLARGYFKQTAPAVLRPLSDLFFDRLFCPYLLRSPEAAADTVLFAATAPAEEVGGRYCGTVPRVTRCSQAANDPALAQRLWDLSVHLCRLEGGDLVS